MVYRSLARDSSDKDKRFPRSAAYIELLDLGLLSLTTAVELEQFDLIEIEADHLHNVPYYAFNFNEKGDTYYKDTECSLYKKRLLTLDLPANCNPPNYHNLWSKLDRKASK